MSLYYYIPADGGQILIETNARLRAVEDIKKTVDVALVVSLASGLVVLCLLMLLIT